jgi:hypothetical protein
MESLLARVRALPDSLQNLVVMGVIVSLIVVVVLAFKAFG